MTTQTRSRAHAWPAALNELDKLAALRDGERRSPPLGPPPCTGEGCLLCIIGWPLVDGGYPS